MTVRFADTFYFLALLNEDDAAHQSALEYAGRRASMLVTTDWVIVEVADALAAPAQRPAFLALWEEIRQRPAIEIVPADRPLLNRGEASYASAIIGEEIRTRRSSFWSIRASRT